MVNWSRSGFMSNNAPMFWDLKDHLVGADQLTISWTRCVLDVPTPRAGLVVFNARKGE